MGRPRSAIPIELCCSPTQRIAILNAEIVSSTSIESLFERYYAIALAGRPRFIREIAEDALGCTDNAFSMVEDASIYLKTVTDVLKQVETTDRFQLDRSTLDRIEPARLRCTSHRVSVKQHTMRRILGDEEYEECFWQDNNAHRQ